MITRRNVVAGGAALVAVPQIARAQAAPVQFRISTAGAEQDWLARSLYQFKEAVEKDLPGQIAVSVHPNSSLFRQGTELPAIQRGNLEMSTMTTFEIEQQLPEYGLFSAGYMFRDYDHMRKVMDGPIGKEYIAAVGSKMGIEIIDFIYLGTRQVNLRQAKDVKTPADLAGVKLRMPPGAGWTALGRGLEAILLMKGAAKLEAVKREWETKKDLTEALAYNRKLWTILVSSVTDETNPLPQNVKRDFSNLAIFVLQSLISLAAEPAVDKVNCVIDINSQIAAGLRA